MAMAGLEERTICFSKGGNSEHVDQKILEAYPMLADAGDYELLRTGEHGNRQLIVFAIPLGGYTVSYLKATIASAKGYLRPLQRDITITSSMVISQGQSQVGLLHNCTVDNYYSLVRVDAMFQQNKPGNHHYKLSGGKSRPV